MAQQDARPNLELEPCRKCGTLPYREVALGGGVCKIWCATCSNEVFEFSLDVSEYAVRAATEEWNRKQRDGS
jgi:hypothetical protein